MLCDACGKILVVYGILVSGQRKALEKVTLRESLIPAERD
jgi:hypothetical protein